MTYRVIFTCDICGAHPDELTQVSLERQLLHHRFGEYVDAGPGGWLVWSGRGVYGRPMYSCEPCRSDLVAYVQKHYAGPHANSKRRYPSLAPDDLEAARRRARSRGAWPG